VEYDTIIVSLLGESDEILDSLWCCLRKELESDISKSCGEEDF
jgi:hypothetical protein